MKAGVESRVESFQAELSKFAARWNQLKPGDDAIESGDPTRLAEAVQRIKEKKEEFKELQQSKEQIMLENYVSITVALLRGYHKRSF